MKIKATKTMARELNKSLKKHKSSSIFCFEYCELNSRQAMMFGGGNFEDDYDFDDGGNLIFKAIRVVYKDECYAMNDYIGTGSLVRIFRTNNRNEYYIEDFVGDVIDEYEV